MTSDASNSLNKEEGEKGGNVGGDDTYIQEDKEQDLLDELEMEMDEYYVE